MSKWIKPSRVRAAISALFDWRTQVKSQSAMHLWPLLALVEKGASSVTWTRFTEQDDRSFWNRYARLAGEARPSNSSKPFTPDYYIEPLVQQLKPSDYPHRSPSSIRDRTFLNAWRAAEYNHDNEEWLLNKNYASIFEEKVLLRNGVSSRVPVVDLAVYLFRDQEFDDEADATTLQDKFQQLFRFEPSDYDKLFVFNEESAANIFTNERANYDELNRAIRSTLISSGSKSVVITSAAIKDPVVIDDDDPHLIEIKRLLKLSSSGFIFRGCPGTGKTWYAMQIAKMLASDPRKDIFQIQFHPSYGYEDFVEGYRPDAESKSGFKIVDRVFLIARARADEISTPVIIIIDEINRGDPARVFGELLTYIEHSYRKLEFSSALSGKRISVPHNLIVFGTMNPYDRSIVQFDAALMRRFDHIDLNPDAEVVERFLTGSEDARTEFSGEQIVRIIKWFSDLQTMIEVGGVGHAYFKDVKTLEDLKAVWTYRILPYCATLLELDRTRLANVKNSFDVMWKDVHATNSGDNE